MLPPILQMRKLRPQEGGVVCPMVISLRNDSPSSRPRVCGNSLLGSHGLRFVSVCVCVYSHTSWNLGCVVCSHLYVQRSQALSSAPPEATLGALLCGGGIGGSPPSQAWSAGWGLTAFPGPGSRNEKLEDPELGPVGTSVALVSRPPTPGDALT